MIAATLLSVAEPLAIAAPPPPKPVELEAHDVALDFEVGVLAPEVGQRFQAQIADQLGAALTAAGYRITADSQAADAKVSIQVLAFDEDLREYEVQITVLRGDEQSALEPLRCTACSETRLFARIVDEAPTLLAAIDPPRDRPQPSNPSEPPMPEPKPAVQRIRPIGAAGISGCLLATGGLVLAGFGVPPLVRGVESNQALGQPTIETRDYRYTGGALLGAGIATTIVGVALLAWDVGRRKPRSSRNSYALELSPSFSGIRFERRF